MDDKTKVGRRIKELREQLGLTQEELAEKASISRSALANYESGVREPKGIILVRLAEALETSADYILTGKTNDQFGQPDNRASLQNYIEQRILTICAYILARHATAEEAAKVFGVSKSTVYTDMTKHLPIINKDLAKQVKKIWEEGAQSRNLKPSTPTRPDSSMEAKAKIIVDSDPEFVDLLYRVKDLTEDEKQSLLEHWEWAMNVIEEERERRRKFREKFRNGGGQA